MACGRDYGKIEGNIMTNKGCVIAILGGAGFWFGFMVILKIGLTLTAL